MKIEIETKFNIGDEVIGYSHGFKKYTVKDIKIGKHSVAYSGIEVDYFCVTVGSFVTSCAETFAESELFTADELRDYVNKFLTFPTTSAEAKHDIDMYSEIKNLIQHRIPVAYLSDNVRWTEYIKWLELKFPEIEQFVKTNKNI